MITHRLRAPSTDGALLAVPPLEEAGPSLDANAERLGRWEYDFQGRRADRLRALARRQVLEQAAAYLRGSGLDVPAPPAPDAPLIVTGHQPDLFHPGVWVKNFAVAAIARAHHGAALNLIVDNDLAKPSSIRIPRRNGGLRVGRVEYDEWTGEVPFEDLRVRDEARFSTFAGRVREALAGAVADPLIDDYWPRAVARRGETANLGLRLALARRELEASWGVRNFEVPLSLLCETEAFLWFAAHLLAQLPRFQEVHNAALARYRAAYGIRSRHHPVPALTRDREWREAPFWIWRADEPRRRPLLVRQGPQTMTLRAGGDPRPLLEIPLGPDREACCAVEQLMSLPGRRIRLRTRALTTTMFARLLLGDLFVHGIGGAKYDELGDEVVRGFFGIEPPSYLTLSMTLWLGIRTAAASPERLASVERSLRDLAYNPDRLLADSREAASWIEAKRIAVAGRVGTVAERRARFLAIRRANAAMQPYVEGRRGALEEERTRLLEGLRQNAIAGNREYSFVVHSERRLRSAMARAEAAAVGERREKIV